MGRHPQQTPLWGSLLTPHKPNASILPTQGKCIGGGNMLPFKCFLGTLLLHAVFTAGCVIALVALRAGAVQ